MLILNFKQVHRCYVITQRSGQTKIVRGISYRGNLFVRVRVFESDRFHEALKICRQLLDKPIPILSLIIEEKNAYTVWSQDKQARLIDFPEIVKQMRDQQGITVKNYRHLFQVHQQCFVGSEAVEWLAYCLQIPRQEAVIVGQLLVHQNIISPVIAPSSFQDSHQLYRFIRDENYA